LASKGPWCRDEDSCMPTTDARPQEYPFRRARTFATPLAFFALCFIVLLGAKNLGMGIFYAVMSLLTGMWLVRSLRVVVRTSTDGLFVRTSFTTRLLPWATVTGAELRPMRTMSPLRSIRSYVALAARLQSGRVLQFDDIAASTDDLLRVQAIVDQINEWCAED
jgi:hypothetical protein